MADGSTAPRPSRTPDRSSSTASTTGGKCGSTASGSARSPSIPRSATARACSLACMTRCTPTMPKARNVLTCPTEWGGFTHRYFVASRTVEEQVAARDAIAAWARLSYGWLGRSPDYKAAFLATLGANAEFYAPYQDNARRWYRHEPGARAVHQPRDHPSAGRSQHGAGRAGRSDRCLHARDQGDRRRHPRQRRQGRRHRFGADAFHLRRASRPDPGAGQELLRGLHRADQRAGREADLPRRRTSSAPR